MSHNAEMDRKFGERKTPTWSQSDWNAHKRLEGALLEAREKAAKIDPTMGAVYVPERSAFDIPPPRKRGLFMLQYATELNRAFLLLWDFYTKNCGWGYTTQPSTKDTTIIRLSRNGRTLSSSYCKSILCIQTWVIMTASINTNIK